MPTSKEYLNYVLEQLKKVKEITYRQMMGEYILYFRGKIIGGIYDNRFLLKDIKAVKKHIKNPNYQIPYDGAKKMILVDKNYNKQYLKDLINDMYYEL